MTRTSGLRARGDGGGEQGAGVRGGGDGVAERGVGVRVRKVYTATSPRGRGVSGTFAVRLAKAAGVTVETVLTGKLLEAGRCPTCGASSRAGGAS